MIAFTQLVKLCWRKIGRQKRRAVAIIIPTLIFIMIVITIMNMGYSVFALINREVFAKLNTRDAIIVYDTSVMVGQTITTDDLAKLKSLEHVERITTPFRVPVNQAETTNLFVGKKLAVSNINGLDPEFASFYTTADFKYVPGQPIPIILSANNFNYNSFEWGDSDSIEIDYSQKFNPADQPETPYQSEYMKYERADLIGKEFTISFGGMAPLPTFTEENKSSKVIFKKLTDKKLAEQNKTQRDDINPYWDYDQLLETFEYNFKIVDILEGEEASRSFVPSSFADELTKAYFEKYQAARKTKKVIPTDSLSGVFSGTNYNGELFTDYFAEDVGTTGPMMGGGPVMVGGGAYGGGQYQIPGLVIERSENTDGKIKEARDLDWVSASHTTNMVILQIDNADNRAEVVKSIQDAGYMFWDMNFHSTVKTAQLWFYRVLWGIMGLFMFITALIILISMGKYVGDSRREIGVFRAIGATKGDIRAIVVVQTLMIIGLAYAIGLAIAIGMQFGGSAQLANVLNSQFGNMFAGMPIEVTIVANDFRAIDWQTLGLYTGALVVITILVALLPARKAAKISPVEAIKNN